MAKLMNAVQILLLFTANFMLMKILKLSGIKRICFQVLFFCIYTNMLFTLMMEQYIIAYFWLIFCLYCISDYRKPHRLASYGCSGTLMTGLILFPSMSPYSPRYELKKWLKDMLKFAAEFIVLMIAFCRSKVIINAVSGLNALMRFSGENISFLNKFSQFSAFLKGIFCAPQSCITQNNNGLMSWQLTPVTGLNVAGIVILVLVIVSAIYNRDKLSSRLASLWVVLSIAVLLILGWGTAENGLILYALYFGWAYFVLLFQLVEKIQDKMKVKWLLPAASICGCACMLITNVPSIIDMVKFAIQYYPA